jgi:predicted DsbA family dithiol-disulfide isomerase
MSAFAKVTYYLDVTSSWVYWAEPMWAELKARYAGRVEFQWKIALLPAEAFPVSPAQAEWFYRRSGTIMRSPFMLNSGWLEADIKEYTAPNAVAEAAKDFGATDDRVRLAVAHAGVREGKKIGRWEVSADIAAQAAGIDKAALLARAQAPEITARMRASSAEFDSFQINQRPAFTIEDSIGDRAVFSGLVAGAPLAATIDAMLADAGAYASYAAHFGGVPSV